MGGWLAVCGRGLRNMFCFVMAFVQGGVNVWAIHCTVATGSVCVVAVVGPFHCTVATGSVCVVAVVGPFIAL
jgi:hypothetical protein